MPRLAEKLRQPGVFSSFRLSRLHKTCLLPTSELPMFPLKLEKLHSYGAFKVLSNQLLIRTRYLKEDAIFEVSSKIKAVRYVERLQLLYVDRVFIFVKFFKLSPRLYHRPKRRCFTLVLVKLDFPVPPR